MSVADGNYRISSPCISVTCQRCGVLIGHRAAHDAWHAAQRPTPRKAKATA